MSDFTMPSLGSEMDSGTLCEWKIRPGDRVKRGDVVAVVDTDKAAIDMEIWEDGVVEDILVTAGEKVPVGTVLAKISHPEEEKKTPQEKITGELKEKMIVSPETKIKVTPLARKVAEELGINPSGLAGTGPGGSITEKDIREAKKRKQVPEEGIRHASALTMAKSKREIPHYYLLNTIDMGPTLEFLEKENEHRSPQDRIIYAAVILKAVSLAAKKYPEMNGLWKEDKFISSKHIHIGMGISLKKRGLISPAILDVDQKPLGEIMSNLRDLIERARNGGLRSSEMMDATITVTNLGELGVDEVFGIIYPPQVALVGFGRILKDKSIKCTLSADHRASDGYQGARFLGAIAHFLEHPELM